MPTFPEALGAALSARFRVEGVKRPATHRQGLTARMGALVKAHGGSYKAAARSAGIPERTWRDWRAAKHPPSARNLRKLEDAYAREVLAPLLARKLADPRRQVTTIYVTAVVVGDPDGSRYVNKGGPGAAYRTFRAEIDGGKVVNRWLSAGAAAAAATYTAETKRVYGIPFGFEGDNVVVDLRPDVQR